MSATKTALRSVLPLLGRLLLASLFLVFAIRSISGFSASAAYFAKLGFPVPEGMVVAAVICQIVGAILLTIGWQVRPAAWLLIIYVLAATFSAHRYWEHQGIQYGEQMAHFYKNLALIGGLLCLASFGPGKLALDKPDGPDR